MFLCEFPALFNENSKNKYLPKVSKKCSKRYVGCSASSDCDRLFGLWNNMKIIQYEMWFLKKKKKSFLKQSISGLLLHWRLFFLISFYGFMQMLQANIFLTKPAPSFGHLLQLIIKSNLQPHSWEKCCTSFALKIQHGVRDGYVAVT